MKANEPMTAPENIVKNPAQKGMRSTAIGIVVNAVLAICKGVAMSEPWQGQAALKVARLFKARAIVIPADELLTADILQVDEVGNTAGGVPVLRVNRTAIGQHSGDTPILVVRSTFPPMGNSSRVFRRKLASGI